MFISQRLASAGPDSLKAGGRTVGRWLLLALVSLGWVGCESASEWDRRRPAIAAPLPPILEIPAPLTTVIVPEGLPIAAPAPLVAPPALPLGQIATSPPPSSILVPASILHHLSSILPLPVWPTNWTNVWIPLEGWAKYNALGKPVQLTSLSPTYEFQTSNGVMSLKMGSRIAHYNGLESWLGYPPQVINGLPCIHWLDAQKNLQPWIDPPGYHFQGDRTIVIDPGHGGKDSGTKSVTQAAFEKEYTLDCALRLRRLLLANGWKVLLTRTNDLEISLPDRVACAERANADLFLSLHFNSGLPNRGLAGVETYCLTPVGLPSSLTRDYEDNLQHPFANNAYDEQNVQIASRLHRSVVEVLCAADRGVRRARFMGVLRGQNRPAVLIEAGYLSNPNEARKIASSDYRQKLAEALAKALEF